MKFKHILYVLTSMFLTVFKRIEILICKNVGIYVFRIYQRELYSLQYNNLFLKRKNLKILKKKRKEKKICLKIKVIYANFKKIHEK